MIGKLKIFLIVSSLISFVFAMEEIPQSAMEIIYVDSEETIGEDGAAANVLDGDKDTYWHTGWSGDVTPGYPHEIVIMLDKAYTIENFAYWPRQSSSNGRIKDFKIFVSNDTSDWGEAVVAGTWEDENNKQVEEFSTPITAQYVKLLAISEVNDNLWASAAEIGLNDQFDINEDLDGWASSLHLSFRDGSDKGSELLMV